MLVLLSLNYTSLSSSRYFLRNGSLITLVSSSFDESLTLNSLVKESFDDMASLLYWSIRTMPLGIS